MSCWDGFASPFPILQPFASTSPCKWRAFTACYFYPTRSAGWMTCYFRKRDRIVVGAVILPKIPKIGFHNSNGYSLGVPLIKSNEALIIRIHPNLECQMRLWARRGGSPGVGLNPSLIIPACQNSLKLENSRKKEMGLQGSATSAQSSRAAYYPVLITGGWSLAASYGS